MRPIPLSPAYEAALLDERDANMARVRAMAEAYAPNADNLAAMAGRYGYAPAGVIAGLGLAGLDPESELAERLAATSLEDAMASPLEQAPTGTPMRVSAVREAENSRPDPDPGMGGLAGLGKGVVRAVTGAVETPIAELGNALTSLGTAALDDRPGFFNDAVDYFQDAPRGHLVKAFFDWRDRGVQQGDWSLPIFEQEYAGSGFFAEGEIREHRETAKENLQVDGHWMSPGRLGATIINRGTGGRLLEPGSEEWNFASGVGDFAFQIFGDPLNYLAGSGLVGKVDNLGRGIRNVDDIVRLSDDLANAPLRGQGLRGVDQDAVGTLWSGNSAGRAIVHALANNPNVAELSRLFGHRVDPQILRQIADTDDEVEIVRLLRQFLGSSVRELPTRGQVRSADPTRGRRLPTFARNWWDAGPGPQARRLTASVPGGGGGGVRIDLSDPAAAVKDLDGWMTAANSSLEFRDDIIRRIVDLGPLDNDPSSYTRLRPIIKDVLADAADEISRVNRLSDDAASNLRGAAARAADRLDDTLDPDFAESALKADDLVMEGETAIAGRVRNRISRRRREGESFFRPDRAAVQAFAEELTRFGERYLTEARLYEVDAMAQHIPMPGMRYRRRVGDDWVYDTMKPSQTLAFVDGEVELLPTALSPMYAMSNSFDMPNTERLIRATGMWARWKAAEVPILGHIPGTNRAVQRAGHFTESIYDGYMTHIQPHWKAAMILRPALLLKNLMENTVSMAGEGYMDLGTRGMDYWAVVAGHGTADLTGESFRAIDGVRAKFAGISDLIDGKGRGLPGTVRSQQWKAVSDADGQVFYNAWARRLMGYAQNEDHRLLASLGPERFTQAFVDGDPAVRRILQQADSMLGSSAGFKFENNPAAVREWAEGHYRAMLEMGGEADARLLEDIANGRIGTLDVTDPTNMDRRSVDNVAQFLYDERRGAAPARVPARADIALDSSAGSTDRGLIGRVFHHIVQAPEQRLSYIPVYSMAYWDEVARLLPYATDDVRAGVLELARTRSGLIREMADDASVPTRIREKFFQRRGQRVLDELEHAAGNGTDGVATLDEFIVLARSNAAERLADVLMDVTERNRFFEGIRLVSPFANVYHDVARRWTKRLNPTTRSGLLSSIRHTRQATKGVTSAQESDPFDFTFMGGEGEFSKGSGRGFFHVDSRGQNQFAFPSPVAAGFLGFGGAMAGSIAGRALGGGAGVGALVGGVAGAGIGAAASRALDTGNDSTRAEFVADPSQLNLVAASPIPGIGPVLQIPATALLANRPDDDVLRQLVLPYGDSDGPLDSFVPPWVERGWQAMLADPDTDAQFGNTVGEVMQALMVEGEFADANTLTTREGQEALLNEATRRARYLTFVRAMAGASFPAAPQVDFSVETDAGWFTFDVVRQELRKLQNELGYDEGFRAFVDLFGSDVLPITQPSTQGVNARRVDTTGADWERQHPEQVNNFREVIGYFAPSDPSAPIDFRAYNATLDRGDRDQLTPRQQLWLYNNTAGRLILNSERNRLGVTADTPEGRQHLRQIRRNLMERYPGFDQVEGIRRKPSQATRITQLRGAVRDPVLSRTETGRALGEWLESYDAALAQMESLGYATLDNASPQAALLRAELQSLGDRLALQHPDFVDVWASVLSREATTEDERNTGLGAA